MKEPVWIVKDVLARDDYTLLITFANGEKRVYNAKYLLSKPIYSQLKNRNYFLNARVACGTVIWDDDVDIAPEHLYECSTPLEIFFKQKESPSL